MLSSLDITQSGILLEATLRRPHDRLQRLGHATITARRRACRRLFRDAVAAECGENAFFNHFAEIHLQAWIQLKSIACDNGIQELIYNGKIWRAREGPAAQNYTGADPHTNHIHVGLNRCGAQNFNLTT